MDSSRMVVPRGGFFDADGEWTLVGEAIAALGLLKAPGGRVEIGAAFCC